MFEDKVNPADDPNVALEKNPTQSTMSVMVRESTEARGAIEAAKAFPRDANASFVALGVACKRPAFAEKANYKFPRGGKPVTGPAVGLAREAARCWGNLTYGIRIISMTDDQVHLQGWAWDMETNARVTVEDIFRPLIQRKDKNTGATNWIIPDERDLRELINRRGALAERNAILKVLPADLIADAREWCYKTADAWAAGELEKRRDDVVREMLMAFEALGVSQERIEERLGHPLSEIDAAELSDMRQVYNSLKDGNSRIHDHFDYAAPSDSLADELNEEPEVEEDEDGPLSEGELSKADGELFEETTMGDPE